MSLKKRNILYYVILAIFSLAFISGCSSEKNPQKDVTLNTIQRILPKHYSKFEIEFLENKDSSTFEIESKGNYIILRGTTGVEVISALNWYLKYFCNSQISWCGNNLNLPDELPVVKDKIVKTSPYKYRYYFNYCTFSYTMAFWDWDRWQQEIDWMALNGINMPLAITGQEAVWREVYHDMGLSDKDLEGFFVGPAYFGWGWMGNIDGWGGPLPQSWIDSHYELQKKILTKMRSLGMTPVLPAFTGHVPKALIEKFPDAHIMQMNSWSNFKGTYILDPMDKLFVEIGKRFIKKQTEMYGTDHLYSADTFNEMDPISGDPEYLSKVAKTVSRSMVEGDSLAVNLMQAWLFLDEEFWTQERVKAYLDAVPNEHMILLDLFATAKPRWKKTEAFYGKPWIWCMLNNWGGKMGMYGRSYPVSHELPSLINNPKAGNLSGIGLTPEGLMTNPFIYDLMTEMAWHSDTVNVENWAMKYIERRYGNKSVKAAEAWKILINTLYDCRDLRHGPQGAHYCMRPTPEFSNGSFVRSELFYDPSEIKKALSLMLEAADELKGSQGYQYDLVDLTRQCMSDLSLEMHHQMADAIAEKNIKDYEKISSKWLNAMLDLDSLLGTREEFLLGKWIEKSKSWATNNSEKELYEWNARNLITLWGNAESPLHDYAQKQWSGLMKDFYYQRWKLFIDYALSSLKSNKPIDMDVFNKEVIKLEYNWTKGKNIYKIEAVGNPIEEAKRLYRNYIK